MNLKELLTMKKENPQLRISECGKDITFNSSKDIIDYIMLMSIESGFYGTSYINQRVQRAMSDKELFSYFGGEFIGKYISLFNPKVMTQIIIEKRNLIEDLFSKKCAYFEEEKEEGKMYSEDFSRFIIDLIREISLELYYSHAYSRDSSDMNTRRFTVFRNLNIFKAMATFFGTDIILKAASMGSYLSDSKDYMTYFQHIEDKKEFDQYSDNINFYKDTMLNLLEREKEYCFKTLDDTRKDNRYIFSKALEYALENESAQSDIIEEKLKKLYFNNTRYSFSFNDRAPYLEYLGFKKPDTFIRKFEEYVLPKVTGCQYERAAFYIGYIATGKANKKFIRRMRSETSSYVSLNALNAIIKYKNRYDNFEDLIFLFNDSKHQDVVDRLVSFYDKKYIMHMIGNPLSNKQYIKEKLMS